MLRSSGKNHLKMRILFFFKEFYSLIIVIRPNSIFSKYRRGKEYLFLNKRNKFKKLSKKRILSELLKLKYLFVKKAPNIYSSRNEHSDHMNLL